MAIDVVRYGPGTLTLGTTPGTDFSCQVQSLGVTVSKNEGDKINALCGDSVPGSITYDYSLDGVIIQDFGSAGGITEYSWTNEGATVEFNYVPSTSATTAIAGSIIMDPMNIAAADAAFGDVLTSDVSWSCLGKPDITWPAAA